MPPFELHAPYEPTGDQPDAIAQLVVGLRAGVEHQVLLGATGTGKTFTIAHVIEQTQKPTLVMVHNKTLAAQLYAEFREFFPCNAVEYFISYYDYYQPEAYVPKRDLYIDKETSVNEEIERLRLAATTSLLGRSDVIIVASVSSIYGLGSPESYGKVTITITVGDSVRRNGLLRRLVEIHYKRNDTTLQSGTFRVRGDILEILPPYSEFAYRIDFLGDEIERIMEVDPLTGEILETHQNLDVFPARHFITEEEKMGLAIKDIIKELEERIQYFKQNDRLLEAQRIEQRTRFDLEMLREVGYCSGIENYSRPLEQRLAGSPPWTLIDYFPANFLMVIDESHMTVPQIRGMYAGDQSRKQVLVEHGFRLPSAMDNRPLNFSEFEQRTNQIIYTSATPGPYEIAKAKKIVQQVIRPTGLLDPQVEVRPVPGQIDDLIVEIRARVSRGERVLITTLTKRMAEDLSNYLIELEFKVQYLHSEIHALERVEILRNLRIGTYDVVVGINLLREGLDLPEVSLVAILDADKEGFLRSATALIQTIGRTARHVDGQVLMYADNITDSMRIAIDETNRRRKIQNKHNQEHGILPASIVKSVHDITDRLKSRTEEQSRDSSAPPSDLTKRELTQWIKDLEKQMRLAAQAMQYEKAALIRDRLSEMRKELVDLDPDIPEWERQRRLASDNIV